MDESDQHSSVSDRSSEPHTDNTPSGATASSDAPTGGTAVGAGSSAAPTGDAVEGAATPRPANRKRRRGSRGGKRRKKPAGTGGGSPSAVADNDDLDDDLDDDFDDDAGDDDMSGDVDDDANAGVANGRAVNDPASDIELPERIHEGRPSPEASEKALVRRPQIGDTRPAPVVAEAPTRPSGGDRQRGGRGAGGGAAPGRDSAARDGSGGRKPQGSGGGRQQGTASPSGGQQTGSDEGGQAGTKSKRKRPNKSGRDRAARESGRAAADRAREELDAETLERRRGRERKGRPVGRYMMAVHVGHGLTQVAVVEGRNLIEHYVSRPADDVGHIHGNIYLGRVQNVLPGMEACFVDIATPKNAVLYAGDVQYEEGDIVERSSERPRIEQILKNKQLILCQVTKNPIGVKGARLTQEVSLPGRFVVLIPNSKTYGISKRLPEDERKRLRAVLDRVKEPEHGLIVRTAAENATEQELRADVQRLNDTWREIEKRAEAARKGNRAQLLYREPDLAVRVIREEFNADYRSIAIDDRALYDEVRSYIEVMNPELVDRVEFYDTEAEGLPLYERFHIHEQLHKALDRKVWLPSGGSLIIEHTEALTVIDVNTGRNVGTSNLEATVLQNNLEAADEIARQLRLRDIGGIIVIDFIDMEIKENRRKVVEAFRDALSRDKTRSQVFDISELGLVEMTRKRIGEGLLQSFATQCPHCEGRGVGINTGLID